MSTQALLHKQLKNKIRQVWEELSPEDLTLYDAARERFIGRIEEKCGVARDEAGRRLCELEVAYHSE
jgi:hypothetical protein